MSWALQSTVTIADLALIELRRIVGVLQVEHASLFLHDRDQPQRAAQVASTGLPVEKALAEPGCSAIAAPLLDEGRAVGVLLVVTVRQSRRLGAFDAKVIARAAETLVNRLVAPQRRQMSDRFSRP
jgi:DNA-binding IclR family transcriptional regulator